MSYRRYPSAGSNPSVSLNGQPIPPQSTAVAGSDGTNLQPLKTDVNGELQIDVLSSALPSGAATEAKQDVGNASLASIDGSASASAASLSSIDGSASASAASLASIDGKLANPMPIDGGNTNAVIVDGSGVTQPISAASLPLPTGAATEATLGDAYVALQSIDSSLIGIDGKLPPLTVNSNLATEVMQINGKIDTGNSTDVALGANGVFTGSWVEVTNSNGIAIGIFSDQNSATNGLEVQYSSNGIHIDHIHYYNYLASSAGVGFQLIAEFRFYRLKYTNGPVAQGSFRMQSVLKATGLFPSQYRIARGITDETQAIYTHGVITGKTTGGGGGYVDVKVNPSGALTADVSGSSVSVSNFPATQPISGSVSVSNFPATQPISAASLPLPTGAATESTLSAMSAKLPATLGQTTMAGSVSVTLASNQSVIGVRQSHSRGEFIRNDYTSTAVTTAAYTQLIASTAAAYSAVEIFDSSGQTLRLAIGGAGSEVDQFLIFPGGNGRIPYSIASGSRISIRAVSATANVGEICINFYV